MSATLWARPKQFTPGVILPQAMAEDKRMALERNLAAAREERLRALAAHDADRAKDAQEIIDWAAARLREGLT